MMGFVEHDEASFLSKLGSLSTDERKGIGRGIGYKQVLCGDDSGCISCMFLAFVRKKALELGNTFIF